MSTDLQELTLAELQQRETSLRRELWKARFDNYTNQLDNTAKIGRLRRDIARVKTVLTARARSKG